ncbi:MAG: hypothetical protein ACKVTZ_04110 [Bacteroidia bacterium]
MDILIYVLYLLILTLAVKQFALVYVIYYVLPILTMLVFSYQYLYKKQPFANSPILYENSQFIFRLRHVYLGAWLLIFAYIAYSAYQYTMEILKEMTAIVVPATAMCVFLGLLLIQTSQKHTRTP